MSTNKSRKDLLEFLDYLARKGLMNQTTARSRKAAANAVLGVLSETEAADVSKIDLDEVMNRFHNLEGSKFTPGSLNTYKSRTRSAIDDFLRYLDNPLSFKAKTPAGSRSARSNNTDADTSRTGTPKKHQTTTHADPPRPTAVTDTILPIPLRADLTIYIQGLPFDLRKVEATKIANVVLAMATDAGVFE